MKLFSLTLLTVLTLSVSSYAAQMHMISSFNLMSFISITTTEDKLIFPTIFSDHVAGYITSEQNTVIPTGQNGQNVKLKVTGLPNSYYKLVFPNLVNIKNMTSGSGEEMPVTLKMGSSCGSATGRTIEASGTDTDPTCIMGTLKLYKDPVTNEAVPGTYREISPVSVTAAYE